MSGTTEPIDRSEAGHDEATRLRNGRVLANGGLVVSLALKFRGRGLDVDDLIQLGTIGLIQADGKFDPGRGLKFSTYAIFWIRKEMLDGIYESRMVRVPKSAINASKAVRTRVFADRDRLGDMPRVADVVDRMVESGEVAAKKRDYLLDAVQAQFGSDVRHASGERCPNFGEDIESRTGEAWKSACAGGGPGDALSDMIADEGRSVVSDAVGRVLEGPARRLIALRYGLGGEVPSTVRDAAAAIGATKWGGGGVERRSLAALRSALGGYFDEGGRGRPRGRSSSKEPSHAAAGR